MIRAIYWAWRNRNHPDLKVRTRPGRFLVCFLAPKEHEIVIPVSEDIYNILLLKANQYITEGGT